MKRSLRFAPLFLALLLSSCSLFGTGSSEEITDLTDARDRWNALGWTDYDIAMMRGCFCLGAGEHDVWVREDEVVAVWPGDEHVYPVRPEGWQYFPSVDELFDLVARAVREADDVTVEYSPHGWPSRIDIDWIKSAVDDEISYQVYEVSEAAPAHPVTLSPGDTYSRRGVVLRFDEISGDSRCPTSVECVWAGEATASFTATIGDEPPISFELVDGAGEPDSDRTRTVGPLRFTLVAVQPYPVEPDDIEPEDYVVRLLVEIV